jgi:hypothetical protein
MTQVSRPLLGLLVATVAVFAVWTFALKGGSSTSNGTGSSTGLGAYQSAIAKAHQAVATSNAASAAHGGTVASAPSPTPATTPAARSATPTTATATHPATTTHPAAGAPQAVPAITGQLNIVAKALRDKKVLALLFFNPAAADDKAVKAELAAVPTHGTKVVKLAVPITALSHFTAVTNQVPVNGSPTLVLINGARQAATIVGFADRFEIAQRVSDALAVR